MKDVLNLMITGEDGTGKTTVLGLFPEEMTLELDDNFNEILQKQVYLPEISEFKRIIIRELNLINLTTHYSDFKKLMESVDIILVFVNSNPLILSSTSDLVATLVGRSNFSSIYIIANFEDKDSKYPETVRKKLKFKTYAFSAIELDSKRKFVGILRNIISISYPSIEKSSEAVQYLPHKDEILIEIGRAIENASQQYNSSAIQMFSSLASLLEKQITDMDLTQSQILTNLCKAWEMLISWDVEKDKIFLTRATEYFDLASEYIKDDSMKGLVSANSIYCEALMLGMEFDESFEEKKKEQYIPQIKILLDEALSIYEKYGYLNESSWVKRAIESIEKV